MIAKEAYDIFIKKYPNLNINSMMDYDSSTYVVCATKGNVIAYDDPFYFINKSTGDISRFLPSLDIEKFDDAATNREIDISDF